MNYINGESEAPRNHSEFEKNYKLEPLGDDFEARAIRAEAILDTVLPELMSISVVVPRSASRKIREMQTTTQELLNQYRSDATVKADQAWKDAYPETEAYE